MTDLKAPFPWFGGKSRVAPLVWSRFGAVKSYVEPFFGSGAVLLGRRTVEGMETVNDLDGYVANFWRALQRSPDAVADAADWPVNEADLHARHIWLVNQRAELLERLMGDPAYCDAQIAGWWVWGISAWIGGGWCSGNDSWTAIDGKMKKAESIEAGVARKRPHLSGAGMGVHKLHGGLHEWMQALSHRLRCVRVCCGDWSRICGPSVVTHALPSGVFFDPPYSAEAGRDEYIYATEDLTVAHAVRQWCIANEATPGLRIALCGYEGEHDLPGWECVPWKAGGGYASQGNAAGKENRHRERIWFSPACLRGGRLL